MESDKGVTIYCIKEDENEDTQVTEVSEPNPDVKGTENIEPVVTEAVEAPRATQTKDDSYNGDRNNLYNGDRNNSYYGGRNNSY